MRDLLSNCQMVHLGRVEVSGTTPATSAYVDLQGYDAATLIVTTNAVTDAGTASGFTITLQESDDTTAAGAGTVATTDTVDGANALTVTSDDDDNVVVGGLSYLGGKRYIGISVTGTTGSAAFVSIIAHLGRPYEAPTTYVGTAVART
ncbi:MAG: hypothetical protein MJH10_09985 [Epibacterium sp.]|nr:hypothetical protein [Epibacterium sp.]NQX73866.1 hypothetical protein [Epibacterium sp.]